MKTLPYFVLTNHGTWQIRKLAKNEKKWRQKLEEERLANRGAKPYFFYFKQIPSRRHELRTQSEL